MAKIETESGSQDLQQLLDTVRKQVDSVYEGEESGELIGDRRPQVLGEMLRLREELLRVPMDNIDPDLDASVESAMDDIEETLEDTELLDLLEAPTLEDPLKSDAAWAPSRPVGEAVLERLENFVMRAVPRREAIRAIAEVAVDIEDPASVGDDADEDLIIDAQALGSDYFLHDWRWLEGRGVFARFLHDEANVTEQDRLAVQVLTNSHMDLYRVEDIDSDRSIISVARVFDGLPVSLEIDEELLGELSVGDGLLARIYAWSDGPELGECLPVDEATLEILRDWMDELLHTDFGPPKLATRSALLKAYGHRLAAELLFPSDESTDTDPIE